MRLRDQWQAGTRVTRNRSVEPDSHQSSSVTRSKRHRRKILPRPRGTKTGTERATPLAQLVEILDGLHIEGLRVRRVVLLGQRPYLVHQVLVLGVIELLACLLLGNGQIPG